MLRRGRRVVPRRTGGSSPASKTGSAPKTGQRPAATCAPGHRADPGWRSHHRNPLRRRHFAGRIHRRTPNTDPAAPFPCRRAGRRTTPRRGAGCDGVPGRAASRPAAGTADPDDHAPRSRSSTPSARPPTRWLTGCRRVCGRFPPQRPPRRAGPARSPTPHLGTVDEKVHGGGFGSRADVQRRDTPQLFFADPQSFAAGRENRYGRRGGEDRLDQIRDTVAQRARSCRTPAAATGPPTRRPPTRSLSCPVAG